MHSTVTQLLDKDQLIPVIAIIGGLTVGAIWVILGTVHAMVVGTAKEKTKRELAAYVAEGTLDADKAVAMINAGKKWDSDGSCCG